MDNKEQKGHLSDRRRGPRMRNRSKGEKGEGGEKCTDKSFEYTGAIKNQR